MIRALQGRHHDHNCTLDPPDSRGRPRITACGAPQTVVNRSRSARGHDVFGFDLSREMLAHGSGPRSQADLRVLPLRDNSVDAAVCTLALTHLPDLEPALRELARVVRPGGAIITSDIHVLSLYLGGVAEADGRRMPATRYFASDYIRAACRSGLDVVDCHEPRWGVVEGEGGPLAQQWCPEASAAAYRDTPAAIVWCFRVR